MCVFPAISVWFMWCAPSAGENKSNMQMKIEIRKNNKTAPGVRGNKTHRVEKARGNIEYCSCISTNRIYCCLFLCNPSTQTIALQMHYRVGQNSIAHQQWSVPLNQMCYLFKYVDSLNNSLPQQDPFLNGFSNMKVVDLEEKS